MKDGDYYTDLYDSTFTIDYDSLYAALLLTSMRIEYRNSHEPWSAFILTPYDRKR